MRWTMMMVLAIAIGTMMPPAVSGEGAIPTDDSPVVYFHMDEENSDSTTTEYVCWLNVNETDPESVMMHNASKLGPGNSMETLNFWVRHGPNDDTDLDADLYFAEEESPMNWTVHIEFSQGAPDEIYFNLYNRSDDTWEEIDSVPLNYSEEGIYVAAFHIPEMTVIPAGNGLSFEVAWWADVGQNEWTVHLNNESFTELPIANDIDDDGIPDYLDDDNGTAPGTDPPNGSGTTNTTSEGGSTEGFPPIVFGVLAIAVMATAIFIAVRRY